MPAHPFACRKPGGDGLGRNGDAGRRCVAALAVRPHDYRRGERQRWPENRGDLCGRQERLRAGASRRGRTHTSFSGRPRAIDGKWTICIATDGSRPLGTDRAAVHRCRPGWARTDRRTAPTVKIRPLTSWRRYHRALVTGVIGALAAVAGWTAGGAMRPLDGLVYDASLALTDWRPGTRDEPVAVIALDRESLDSPELSATPRVFLSPQWAKIVNALTDAQAGAIGFDIIFSYAANQFPGLEQQGQYDWDFLSALTRARDRVVLARSSRAYPAMPFIGAVFDPVAYAGRTAPGAIV